VPAVFSPASGCGGAVMLRLINLGPAGFTVEASGPAGKVVSLQAGGLPGWASFSPTPGNPARGTLSATLNLGNLFDVLFALFNPTASNVTIGATYPGAPSTTNCALSVRLSLI
jgi:hypothetical protein